jgi:hypothetical protein
MKSFPVCLLIAFGVLHGSSAVQAADTEQPSPKADTEQPRLKYRSNRPVCSCTSGLDEEAIQKAWVARFAPPEKGRPARANEDSQTLDQQKEKAR